jgi:hypothetical protein
MSTGERASWIVALVGLGLVLAPFMSDAYATAMGDGAFALLFVGAIAGLTAFIMVFFFRARNRYRRALLADRGVLAHWRYSEAEWRTFAGEERTRQSGEKRGLLKITGIIMVVVAVPFVIYDREAGMWIAAVLFGTWVLCWIAARLSLRSQAASKSGPPPEARIGANALLLGNELHIWRGWGNLLEGCAVESGPPPALAIDYSAPAGRSGRTQVTVRVPIPPGHEAEAADVRRRIAAA